LRLRPRAALVSNKLPWTTHLNIAGLSQLPATQLPLRDYFEPDPTEVERLDVPFRCRKLVE